MIVTDFSTAQIEEAINDELDAAQNCKRRVEHLKIGLNSGSGSLGECSITYSLWKKTRVERFLVDHLLRSGHYNTGIRLVIFNPDSVSKQSLLPSQLKKSLSRIRS